MYFSGELYLLVRAGSIDASATATIDNFRGALVNINFTIGALVAGLVAITVVAIDAIYANAAILTRSRLALVNIGFAKFALKTQAALAHGNLGKN